METLVVKVNLSLIIDGIEIDLNVTNLTLQTKWKFKDGQA
jgi:hypothetical protein